MRRMDVSKKIQIVNEFFKEAAYRTGRYKELAAKYNVSYDVISTMAKNFRRGKYNDLKSNQIIENETEVKNEGCTILYKEDELVTTSCKWTHAPSPEEVIKLHNIDTTKWKMNQLWVKEGHEFFTTSANFVPLFTPLVKTTGIEKEEIQSIIQNAVKGVTPFPKKTVSTVSNERALFVYLSDKHFGAHTVENSIYDNPYNMNVVQYRMNKVLDEILDMNHQHKFDRICIFDLGDSVDGWNGHTTRGGHKLPQKLNNRETFELYFNTHMQFFDKLMTNYKGEVDYRIMTEDNHGGDFGFICNKAVEQYIKAKYSINVFMTDKHLSHFDYGCHTFVLTHGKDSLDMKQGYPLMLNPKTETHILKYLTYHNIVDNKRNVHFIKGDLHQNASQHGSSFRYRNVMSLYGMSRWSMVNFGPNKAGCSFDIVEKETPKVLEYCLTF